MGNFGARIVELRTGRNMSTKTVAQAVGIPQSRYSELERGIRMPTETQAQRLENFFNLGAGELAGPAADDMKTAGRLSWN